MFYHWDMMPEIGAGEEICFEVDGLPPSKNGTVSPLSSRHPHSLRAQALLAAAREAAAGHDVPWTDRAVGLEVTLLTPASLNPWDATNYLGGIADVLQRKKSAARMDHLGDLRDTALYRDDRQIRIVRYDHEPSTKIGYRMRLWSLGPLQVQTTAVVQLDGRRKRTLLRTGVIPLDFVNTASGRGTDFFSESLADYRALVDWATNIGSLAERDAAALLIEADRRPQAADGVLADGIRFRESLARIVLTISQAEAPEQVDLATLNAGLAQHLPHQRLDVTGDRIGVSWSAVATELDRVLWPVTKATVDFLTGRDLWRMRVCPAHGCGLVFIDTSRNRTRRWCSMRICGNRSKVRRFYERHRRGAHVISA